MHATKMLSAAVTLALLGAATMSCSRASTLCGLVCDCEHCNDWEDEQICDQISLSQDVAGTYGCDSAWEAWADCFENSGMCYEEQAVYSTRDLGSCSLNVDTGTPCGSTAECTTHDPTYFCSNNTCVYLACTNTQQACTTHQQCGQGDDKCNQASLTLLDCERQSSDINFVPIYGPMPEQP
jgi:hypothetical protein